MHASSALEHIANLDEHDLHEQFFVREVYLERGVIMSLRNDAGDAVSSLLKAVDVNTDEGDRITAAALAGLAFLTSRHPTTVEVPAHIRLAMAEEDTWMAPEHLADCAATFFAMQADDFLDDLDNKTTLARLLQTGTHPIHPRTASNIHSFSGVFNPANNNWIIVKPERLSDGRGVTVHRSQSAAFEDLKSRGIGHLAQVYVDPYLIQHRKFDFRLYMVLTTADWYIHPTGFVRFAPERHTWDSTAAAQHLTNTAVTKQLTSSEQISCADGSPMAAVWSIESALPHLNVDTFTFWSRVVSLVNELRNRTLSSTSLNEHVVTPQIVGLDLLVDATGKMLILEFNRRPYLSFACRMQRDLKATLLRDAIKLGRCAQYSTCSEDILKNWMAVPLLTAGGSCQS
jgi:hypothetical protein